ncbi:phosphopantetheine-binding protein [Longispora urticae]
MTVRDELAALVSAASDGEVSPADVLAADSLPEIGVTSLTILRLVDAVEDRYGLSLDLDADATFLHTLDGLTAHVTAHTDPAGAESAPAGTGTGRS